MALSFVSVLANSLRQRGWQLSGAGIAPAR
jgi:hypothetical protein